MFNSIQLALISMIFILIVIVVAQVGRQDRWNKVYRTIMEIGPAVVALSIIYQLYTNYLAQRKQTFEQSLRMLDGSWQRVLDYIDQNYDNVLPLYIEIFPNEARALRLTENESPPIIQDQISPAISRQEFQLAHRIAQTIENFLEMNGQSAGRLSEILPSEHDTWKRIFQSWLLSPRLNHIWQIIKESYDIRTQQFIECLAVRVARQDEEKV